MKTLLKMKIGSLAAEAAIIHREERKWRGTHPMRARLHEHRVNEVRKECHAALIVYGFMRGRHLKAVCDNMHDRPRWDRVMGILKRFNKHEDPRHLRQWFAGWVDAAGLPDYLKPSWTDWAEL